MIRETHKAQREKCWAIVRLPVFVVAMAATAAIATILTRLLVPAAPSPWHDLVWIKNVALPVAMFALYAWLVHSMEHRDASEINPGRGASSLLPGLLIGTGVIACFTILLWSFGIAHISSGTALDGFVPALAMPIVTAAIEELLFRAIILRLLEEMFGSLVGVLGSAALFGLAHIANPGATPSTIFALSIELGVMLALAYILTRNIWFPVAIHAAWNFAQAYVFGTLNSGVRDPHTYFRTDLIGPDILTGGTFGPEGSIVTLILCVAVAAMLYRRIVRAGTWQPMRFQLRGEPRGGVAA